MTWFIVLQSLAILCFLGVGYAFWEASFHRSNVSRILRNEPKRVHQIAWQAKLCDWMTR